ncbi:uncharacterized protein BDW43DRAFT_283859 [Aspergillus alliaceus]|uniref:uncharacterized protein n=1 Tax=Petromyces alliaceus TaxID=209559 RepID=UPI0012A6A763|nr:uncharacterized protein BDW43DRAFT_283859 [Aspergillus alliaceus]KAB8230964.1 hypothetical protein BDW43DRAFT_283859 [Aspergillus alliaceus]
MFILSIVLQKGCSISVSCGHTKWTLPFPCINDPESRTLRNPYSVPDIQSQPNLIPKMGLRGLWNLHIHEKWYRSCHPRGRTSPPEDKFTLQTIKKGS